MVVLGTMTLSAQDFTNAIIKYEQKINVHANLSGAQKAMKAFIPEFVSNNLELHYKDGVARIKEIKSEQKGGIQISSSSQDILLDINNKTTKNFTNLGEEKFYTESIFDPKEEIKFLDNTKEIGRYNCKSAEMKINKDETMIIWYCEDLPAYFSPMGLLQVPGMVLELESEKISYIFKGIEQNAADESLLVTPEGYKKVTEEQLMDLTEEHMEDMMPE